MSDCICGGCICGKELEGQGLVEDIVKVGKKGVKKVVKKGEKVLKEKGEKLVKSAKKVGSKELKKLKDLDLEDLKDTKKVGKYIKKVGKEVVEGMEGEGVKKTNPWIAHIKKVAKDEGISYKEAIKIAGKTYEKKK